jgi:hypothetical protein
MHHSSVRDQECNLKHPSSVDLISTNKTNKLPSFIDRCICLQCAFPFVLSGSTPHDLKAKNCKKPPHRKFQYWVLVLETQVLVLNNSSSSFSFFIF